MTRDWQTRHPRSSRFKVSEFLQILYHVSFKSNHPKKHCLCNDCFKILYLHVDYIKVCGGKEYPKAKASSINESICGYLILISSLNAVSDKNTTTPLLLW